MFSISISIVTLFYVAIAAAIGGVLLYLWFTRNTKNDTEEDDNKYQRGRMRTAGFEKAKNVAQDAVRNSWFSMFYDTASSFIYPEPELRQVPVPDVVDRFGGIPSSAPANTSSFKKIGHEVFKSIIKRAGGDVGCIRYGVNIEVSDYVLETDSYYDDGTHRIAIIWQDLHQIAYPNHMFKSRDEFNRYRKYTTDAVSTVSNSGIHVVEVPCTIDTFTRDRGEPSGVRFVPDISEDDRRSKIKSFLKTSVREYISSTRA